MSHQYDPDRSDAESDNTWPIVPESPELTEDLMAMHNRTESKTGDRIGNVIGGLILGSLVCLVLAVIWRVIFILLGIAHG